MAVVPYSVNGRIRLAVLPRDADGEDQAEWWEEQARRRSISTARQYYAGEQYDQANYDRAKACGLDPDVDRLPEHERLHAYSTQIGESVDFLADQLSDGFRLEAADGSVQDVLDVMTTATDALTGGEGDDDLTCDEVLRDALIAGDVAYEVRWDPIDGTCWLEFWESENVQFFTPNNRTVTKVQREEIVWVEDDRVAGTKRQVTERVVYETHLNDAGVMEARRDVYWDEEDTPRESHWLGLPFIPWGLLRGQKTGLRSFRGQSVITAQAMDSADRYNAVEHTAWLIARYNSHGNLVVVGDAAQIQVREEERVHKDVADVLTFPGGTNAFALTLPTDPQMIEHQRQVTSDAIYAKFGLTRVEPDTISTLGGVSGYALEILNRKSEGTFRRIRRQWRKDWKALVNMVLDVTAYRQEAVLAAFDPETGGLSPVDLESDPDLVVPEGLVPVTAFWEVDPMAVFPNREVEIRMGSGYIVDDVAIRDDYTAKLISREEALRQRGRSGDEITEIVGEIQENAPAETGTFAPPRVSVVPAGAGRGTAAGGTVAGTTAREET